MQQKYYYLKSWSLDTLYSHPASLPAITGTTEHYYCCCYFYWCYCCCCWDSVKSLDGVT